MAAVGRIWNYLFKQNRWVVIGAFIVGHLVVACEIEQYVLNDMRARGGILRFFLANEVIAFVVHIPALLLCAKLIKRLNEQYGLWRCLIMLFVAFMIQGYLFPFRERIPVAYSLNFSLTVVPFAAILALMMFLMKGRGAGQSKPKSAGENFARPSDGRTALHNSLPSDEEQVASYRALRSISNNSAAQSLSTSLVFCSSCGASLAVQTNFCGSCGTAVNVEAPLRAPEYQPPAIEKSESAEAKRIAHQPKHPRYVKIGALQIQTRWFAAGALVVLGGLAVAAISVYRSVNTPITDYLLKELTFNGSLQSGYDALEAFPGKYSGVVMANPRAALLQVEQLKIREEKAYQKLGRDNFSWVIVPKDVNECLENTHRDRLKDIEVLEKFAQKTIVPTEDWANATRAIDKPRSNRCYLIHELSQMALRGERGEIKPAVTLRDYMAQ